MSDNNIPKKIKVASNISAIFFALLTIAWTSAFVLTNAVRFLAFAVVSAAALIFAVSAKKSPDAKVLSYIVGMAGVTLFFSFILSMPSLSINSRADWKYPFQRFYVGCYQNVKEPEWFPDFLEDVRGDYSFSYMPSLMQGSGFYRVYFTALPETVSEYEKEFSPKAQYTIPVSEFMYGDSYTVYDKNGNDKGKIYISLPEEFGESATVYVIDTNLDWNHHHTSAVIVDPQQGKIGLIQEG